jgi:hypothetical protein
MFCIYYAGKGSRSRGESHVSNTKAEIFHTGSHKQMGEMLLEEYGSNEGFI